MSGEGQKRHLDVRLAASAYSYKQTLHRPVWTSPIGQKQALADPMSCPVATSTVAFQSEQFCSDC